MSNVTVRSIARRSRLAAMGHRILDKAVNAVPIGRFAARGMEPLEARMLLSAGDLLQADLSAEPQAPLAVTATPGGTVTGRAWNDVDLDGYMETGESSLDGVTVNLWRVEKNADATVRTERLIASTTTAAGGAYRFEGITLSTTNQYFVEFVPTSGWAFTPNSPYPSYPFPNSDADPRTGRTSLFTLSATQKNLVYDAGLYQSHTISGTAYLDLDMDGVKDSNDPGLAGWTIRVSSTTAAPPKEPYPGSIDRRNQTVVTDENGNYTVMGLPAGKYNVSLSTPLSMEGSYQKAQIIDLSQGQPLTGINFWARTTATTYPVAPIGPGIPVANATDKDERDPSVATDSSGSRTIVTWWQADGNDSGDIYARVADGRGVFGAPFIVNTTRTGEQRDPVVACEDGGRSVIVWKSLRADGKGYDLYAQRYDRDGKTLSKEFKVNQTTTNVEGKIAVAMDNTERFTIAWTSGGQIYAKAYNEIGGALSGDFRVSNTAGAKNPDVAVGMGTIAIAWQATDGDQDGIYYQTFYSGLTRRGDATRVNSQYAGNQHDPSIGIAYRGSLVVSWVSDNSGDAGSDIYCRQFDLVGPQSTAFAEQRVNQYTNGDQIAPDVAALENNQEYMITWQSAGQDGSGDGVYTRRFSILNCPLSDETSVTGIVAGNQRNPAAAMASSSSGGRVVVWESESSTPGKYDIYAQLFQPILHPASVGGIVWNDLNTDGIQDAQTEPGIDGVTVTLYRGEMPLAATVTQDGGHYRFNYLLPDTNSYWLHFDTPAGCFPTLRNQGTRDAYDSDIDPATGNTSRFSLSPDQTDLTRSAGYYIGASISGTVFNDANADGLRGKDESGLKDWKLYLDTNFNGKLDPGEPTAITNAEGAYKFDNLQPGVYRVAEIQPSTLWRQTSPAGGAYAPFLGPNQALTGLSFGNRMEQASVGGMAWNDLDGDGIQEQGEPWLKEVSVKLLNNSGDVVASTWTSADGRYRFDLAMPSDTYYLQFEWVLSKPMVFTLQNQTNDEARDSDVDMNTGRTAAFTLKAGQEITTKNAGLIAPSTITGKVYNDSNRNGKHEASEAGLAQWTVYIDANANGQFDPSEPSAKTDDKGAYALTGLRPGTYTVRQVLQEGWQPVQPAGGFCKVDVTTSKIYTASDFLNQVTNPLPLIYRYRSEFHASTSTSDNQFLPDVALNDAGNHVVVWASTSPGKQGIFGQLYNAEGEKQGQEFRISTSAALTQSPPSVAMDAAGNFTVVWVNGFSGAPSVIRGQRFNALGEPVGNEFTIETGAGVLWPAIAIAMNAGGDSVVTWLSSGKTIFAQRLNQAGAAQGSPIKVGSDTDKLQANPAVAIDNAGNFVVTWTRNMTGNAADDVYAQCFNASGEKRGDEFRVNTYTTNSQLYPKVAIDPAGDFVIVWQSMSQAEDADIYAQRYSAQGLPKGSEFRVNAMTTAAQTHPDVAMDRHGGFVVTYESTRISSYAIDVYAQRFNRAGIPQGTELRANSYVTDAQDSPAVSMDGSGNFVVVWSSNGQDASAYGVYGQRYHVSTAEANIVDVTPDPRATGVDDITINFTAPVTGFDLADLVLSRNGGPNLLTSAQTLASDDGQHWTLANLGNITSAAGQYSLTLKASGSDIYNDSGWPLFEDATETFSVLAPPVEGATPLVAAPSQFQITQLIDAATDTPTGKWTATGTTGRCFAVSTGLLTRLLRDRASIVQSNTPPRDPGVVSQLFSTEEVK